MFGGICSCIDGCGGICCNNLDDVDLFIVAGEHSGDRHAATVVRRIKSENPNIKISAIGGKKLRDAGADVIFDLTKFSVVGFFEVLKHYNTFKKILKFAADFIELRRPKVVCFVDFPGFNLRLAKLLFDRGISVKAGGNVRLYYYISPQIWAWKSKRRFFMEKYIDSLGVIFPFEVDCFADTSLDVNFVGHPFVEEEMPFYYDECGPLLLLAGSRVAAVKRMLPVFLKSAKLLIASGLVNEISILFPDEKIKATIENILADKEFNNLRSSIILLEHCDNFEPIGVSAAIMSSGTASFMVGLAGIPGVIAYRANIFTYFLAKMLVKVKFLSIANILLNNEAYPEILRHSGNQSLLICDKIKQQLQDKDNTRDFFKKVSADLYCVLSSSENLKSPEKWLMEGVKSQCL